MWRSVRIGLGFCLFTACSNTDGNDAILVEAVKALAGSVSSQPVEEGKPSEPRRCLTVETGDAAGIDLLYAEVPSRTGRALLTIAGRNGARTTWLSEDRISLVFEGQRLIATRGFGEDLMGASVPPLTTTSSRYARVYAYLDGLSQDTTQTFSCTSSITGRDRTRILAQDLDYAEVTEQCISDGQKIENVYFIGNSGAVLQSKEWVSAEVGYVMTERLTR